MTEKEKGAKISPLDKEKVLEKISNNSVKVKGQQANEATKTTKAVKKEKSKREEAKPTEEKKPAEKKAIKPQQYTDEQFIEAVKKAFEANGNKPATSRQISDALGIKDAEVGRALVRRTMERLITEGKVKSAKPSEGIRAGKVYALPGQNP